MYFWPYIIYMALGSNWYPSERFDCCAVDGKLSSPSAVESLSWKGTCQCGWTVPELCSLLSSPQDLWTYRSDSCWWWLRHLWGRLHVFFQETITGVVLRHDWASGHSSCRIYCWGVWINDQMDSTDCTILPLNCQLHCEYPTVFTLYTFFHSVSEFRRISSCLLIFKPPQESEHEQRDFLFPLWCNGSSRTWRDVPCLDFFMIKIVKRPCYCLDHNVLLLSAGRTWPVSLQWIVE